MQRKAPGTSAGATSKAAPTKNAAIRTAEAHAVSGPMSLGNFGVPGFQSPGRNDMPSDQLDGRPSSRGGRDASRRAPGGGRESGLGSSSGISSTQQRPSTRNGREHRSAEMSGDHTERPGTRNGRGQGSEPVVMADGWGDMFATDNVSTTRRPGPGREDRPSSRQGGARAPLSSNKGSPKLQPMQAPGSRPRMGGAGQSSKAVAEADAGTANSDDELEQLVGDIGDSDSDKGDDADFEQFLLTGESPVLDKPHAPKAPVAPPQGHIDIAPVEATRKSRGERKHRSKEEKEEKRGEIVDHLIERMVRAAEQDVSENSAAYYDVGLYRKKSLKEANAALEIVFDAAWATIDLEMKLAAIEQLEMASQAEADVWLQQKLEGHDWQYRMRQELKEPGMALAGDDFAALPPAQLASVEGGRRRLLDEDEVVDDDAVLRALAPMQDPLDALVATKMNAKLPDSSSTIPGARMTVEKLPSRAGQSFTPTMAHHGLRRLR